jgi:hypothetical protein
MKLKCVEHNKRVMVIQPQEAIHRSDGSKCNSMVGIGNYTVVTTEHVYCFGDNYPDSVDDLFPMVPDLIERDDC